MSFEQTVADYIEVREKINVLEEKKKVLSAQILSQMEEKKVEKDGYTLRRQNRLVIKLSIEQARQLGAVMMKEAVDREKIKTLHQLGQEMEGVTESESLLLYPPRSHDVGG